MLYVRSWQKDPWELGGLSEKGSESDVSNRN